MSKTDLHTIKLKAFQQPIRCCNVTAIAYGLTALGCPTSIDDIFYVTRLPIDTVLDDGMTLAETYDTCVKYVEEKNLPVSVIVEHFDKASVTLESFIQEIERAVYDENDIHILNFNVDIAHEIKLGGGHFSLLADYDKTTQELTIADTNPKRYTRFWKCPVERMFLACIDRDSAADRARGMIILKKVQSNEQKAQDPELMSAI